MKVEPRCLAANFSQIAMNAKNFSAHTDESQLCLRKTMDGGMALCGRDPVRVAASRNDFGHEGRESDKSPVDLSFGCRNRLLKSCRGRRQMMRHSFSFPEGRFRASGFLDWKKAGSARNESRQRVTDRQACYYHE